MDKKIGISRNNSHQRVTEKQVIRVKEAAEFLGISEGHLYNLCSRREIPFLKKRKLLYFVRSELEDWLLGGR